MKIFSKLMGRLLIALSLQVFMCSAVSAVEKEEAFRLNNGKKTSGQHIQKPETGVSRKVSKSSGNKSARIRLPKQENSGKVAKITPAQKRTPKTLWVTITSLVLVLVLIVLGASLWKKHGPQMKNGLPEEAFQLLGKKPLDQKSSILFFRVGSKILVVSSGTDGLRTLSEIEDPVEVDYLTGICKQDSTGKKTLSPFGTSFVKTVNQKQTFQDKPSSDELGNTTQEEESYTPYQNG